MTSKIPYSVKKAAKYFERYDGYIERLGVYKNQDVYIYTFREEVTIGLPEIYLWDGKHCETVFGEDAFKILNTLI